LSWPLSDKDCFFYTDHWDAFAAVLPKGRHIIGKAYTSAIERDNANTRHHLARMTRKTKVVSQSEDMVDASLKLWCALNVPAIFKSIRKCFYLSFDERSRKYLCLCASARTMESTASRPCRSSAST
jgi:hypothetical protein